jgi:hypothetical protein
MREAIEKAVKKLTEKSADAALPHEAMNYAQAALNLAHAFETLKNADRIN